MHSINHSILSVLAALYLANLTHAFPHFVNDLPLAERQATGTSNDAPVNTLEPVIPPAVDEGALSVLAPDQSVVLAWAGATSSQGSKLRKRDGAVLTQADFTFKNPAVALDHSTFISGVKCSGGTLTATLTQAAYNYVKPKWGSAGNILFVTSADGCGSDNANDLFQSTSITFSDSSLSFTATGASAGYADVAANMILEWGNLGTTNVKRAVDKRHLFEHHPLSKRLSGSLSYTIDWDIYAHYPKTLGGLGLATDAPWPDAALLTRWNKDGGKDDDSRDKGEVAGGSSGHHKRWDNETTSDLLARETEGGLDYGLSLYCVECGFDGSITLHGRVEYNFIIDTGLKEASAGFYGHMKAGLNLGMDAFVKYEKSWTKELIRFPVGGFDILDLVTVGPYISVSVKATAGISATGSLLIGAGVVWPNIDVNVDLANSNRNKADGLVPQFVHKAEAKGELAIEASLGLPVAFGIGVRIIGDLWHADAAIVDTPSIVAKASFEISATVNDDGTIETDINGGCYGIAWSIFFRNELDAVLSAKGIAEYTDPLINPMESDPIAEGCIGYVDDGTDEGTEVPDAQGSGSGTGMTGNGLNSEGNGLSGNSGSNNNNNNKVSSSAAVANNRLAAAATGSSNADAAAASSSSAAAAAAASSSSVAAAAAASSSSVAAAAASSKAAAAAAASSSSAAAAAASSSSVAAAAASSKAAAAAASSSSVAAAAAASSSSVAAAAASSKAAAAAASSSSVAAAAAAASSSSAAAASRASVAAAAARTTAAAARTTAACSSTSVATNPSPSPTVSCKKTVTSASVASSNIIATSTAIADVGTCAGNCLKNKSCLSFSYNGNKLCALYKVAYSKLGATTKSGSPTAVFYDQACYMYACPK